MFRVPPGEEKNAPERTQSLSRTNKRPFIRGATLIHSRKTVRFCEAPTGSRQLTYARTSRNTPKTDGIPAAQADGFLFRFDRALSDPFDSPFLIRIPATRTL